MRGWSRLATRFALPVDVIGEQFDNLVRRKRVRYRPVEVDGTVMKWYSQAA